MTSATDGSHLVLFGTHDFYVYSARFDPARGSLELVQKKHISEHTSWLTRHPTIPDIVYCNGWVNGKVFCLRVSSEEGGHIEVLDEADTNGVGPTHLAVSHNPAALLIAHYGQSGGGSMAMLPLSPTTGRFEARATDTASHFVPSHDRGKWSHPRLDAPHVHQVIVRDDDDGGLEVLACDLGNNVVWRLEHVAYGNEAWKVKGQIGSGLKDGDGPRHAVVHPKLPILYVLNEVSSSLTVHSLSSSASSESSAPLARFSLLSPDDEPHKADMTAAEIALLPPVSPGSPSLLLCTNRFSKHPEGDTIALFAVNDEDGSVTRAPQMPWYRGVGQHVRALDAHRNGKYIATAGRDGGGAVILERTGPDGLELKEVARLDIPLVVDALWMS